MPSPIAHCKQFVLLVLLVVSLFLLGCVVPSSVGSTVDIRRQNEDNKDLSKHNTAKRKKNRWDGVLLSPPVLLQTDNSRN